MREVWTLQSRFHQRRGGRPHIDCWSIHVFVRLTTLFCYVLKQVAKISELAEWWTRFQEVGSAAQRKKMTQPKQQRRSHRSKPKATPKKQASTVSKSGDALNLYTTRSKLTLVSAVISMIQFSKCWMAKQCLATIARNRFNRLFHVCMPAPQWGHKISLITSMQSHNCRLGCLRHQLLQGITGNRALNKGVFVN